MVEAKEILPGSSDYSLIHHLINHESFELPENIQKKIESIEKKYDFNHTKIQAEDIQQRYKRIRQVIKKQLRRKA